VGIVSRDARGFDMTKWHHLECFPVGTASVGSAETIKGFETLQVLLYFVNLALGFRVWVLLCLVDEKVEEKKSKDTPEVSSVFSCLLWVLRLI
jgi:hypothetical protein